LALRQGELARAFAKSFRLTVAETASPTIIAFAKDFMAPATEPATAADVLPRGVAFSPVQNDAAAYLRSSLAASMPAWAQVSS
jgi:hypothetical protein